MKSVSPKLNFLFLLNRASASVSRRIGGHGLSLGDLAVLYAISQAPEGKIRRIDLAEQVGLTASGVTRVLIPLERMGVVKREAHPRDARVSYAALTRGGKELFQDSLKLVELKCDEAVPDSRILSPASELLQQIAAV